MTRLRTPARHACWTAAFLAGGPWLWLGSFLMERQPHQSFAFVLVSSPPSGEAAAPPECEAPDEDGGSAKRIRSGAGTYLFRDPQHLQDSRECPKAVSFNFRLAIKFTVTSIRYEY